jgi:hypothetical protein
LTSTRRSSAAPPEAIVTLTAKRFLVSSMFLPLVPINAPARRAGQPNSTSM